jgi:hypothetical protein
MRDMLNFLDMLEMLGMLEMLAPPAARRSHVSTRHRPSPHGGKKGDERDRNMIVLNC